MNASTHPFHANGQSTENDGEIEVNSSGETTGEADGRSTGEAGIPAVDTGKDEEIARLRDQLMRAVAETDNVRKRAQRSQEETTKYAVTDFARDMVSVLENLTRASENIPAQARVGNDMLQNLGEGIDLTTRELLNTFEKYGIRRIDPLNQKFDHNYHQAVVQLERDDVPPGTVVQVVQAGYVIHDRLLRPAMVAVSKQADPSKKVDTIA